MLTVTYHAGHDGESRTMRVDAEIGTDHDKIARIIAIALTGDVNTAHVLTIDSVESAEVSAYAAELRERHDRIAAGLTAFRAVSPFEGMTPSRRGAADTAMMEARDHVWGMYQAEVAKVVGR